MSIPIIDLTDALKRGARRREAVAREFQLAAETAGFFYVANHGVSEDLIKSQFEVAALFFDLTAAEKEAVSLEKNVAMRGYEPVGSQTLDKTARADLKESFQCGIEYAATHPYVVKRYAGYGSNQWPAEQPDFRRTCGEYIAALTSLSHQLMQLLARSLLLPEDYFDGLFRNPSHTLRLLRYPPRPPDVDARTLGAGAHTDWGSITILAQDANGGLEVKMPYGQWLPATPTRGTFVVNLGDMIPRWTNGRYRSNYHRVLNTDGQQRQSVVFFTGLDWEARIEPLTNMAPGDEAGFFKACTVGEHMNEMYRRTYSRQRADVRSA
jgi:isopenicillin N synthase-like dioxygenase